MSYAIRTRDQHLANDGRPKRILALDGGGLRGILTLGILQKIEDILSERHGGGDSFRLCHYFDLIAGTSTGAIIAATLGLGWTVEEIRQKYTTLGARVFDKSPFRLGFLRAKYDEGALIEELKAVFSATTTLGGPELKTGVLIVTKRLDSGSWWPFSNNPRGKYFAARPNGVIGNGEYPLWQVVRASTAAPSYFDPERIAISRPSGAKAMEGEFVDGGMSPFNNPALIATMYATLDGYRIGWPTGGDKLFVVSVGTGTSDPAVARARVPAENALKSLLALMGDCAQLQETMMQWMSASRTARVIDRELGDLQHDLVAGAPLLNYQRYNIDLTVEAVQSLDPTLTDTGKIESLSAMDSPANMGTLFDLGVRAAQRDVRASDFPAAFDLSLAS